MKAYVFFNRRLFVDPELTLQAHFKDESFVPDFNDYDLEWVLDGDEQTPEAMAAYAFVLLNQDDRPNPTRSMSVGDLVVVTNPPEQDVFLLCESVGWRRVVPELA